ncbi:centrosomal protein of 95 kDa [Trichonephila clavipes]|nr:centrosomal protein of 95 kDa [Trichonephila clavipes]
MSNSDINDSSNSLEEKCLDLANLLIRHCKRPYPRVQCIRDINSDLIIWLFENITHCSIPDLLLCTNIEEEAHNVQAVIDTLSLDLLGISLSHIVGEDIVAVGGLKRKIIRKKKIASKRKSKTHDDSFSISISSKDKKSGSSMSESASGFIEPKLIKPGLPQNILGQDTNIGMGSHFSQEKIISSDYAFSSSSASPPSKLRRNDKITVSSEKSSFSEEIDHGIFSKSEQQQPNFQISSKNTSTEKKLHFQIEKAPSIDKFPTVLNEIPSVSQDLKRKVCKFPNKREASSYVRKEQEVEKLYEKNMKEHVRVLLEKNSSIKPRASHLKRLQLQNLRKPHKTPFPACKKSFLLPHSLRRRSIPRTSLKKTSFPKTNIPQSLQKKTDKNMREESKTGFVCELFQEFPGLQLTPTIINHINKRYQQHLLKIHKQMKSCLLKKSKSQLQAEEAAKRQSMISNLLKKNIQEEQYMQKLKEKRETENKIRYQLRDARLQSAKMKQYCDEFQAELRKKMQKRNYTEELILEKVFMDALEIQKDQVDYLCQEVKETEENDAKQHLAYLDALENLYQTQFSMISEVLITEKKDTQERINSQKQVMRSMQREFKEELKKEIRFMQKAIVEITEDTHFREMDAELYKTKLRKKYS